MGKITGFLEFDRKIEEYAPVETRVKNYKEFIMKVLKEKLKIKKGNISLLSYDILCVDNYESIVKSISTQDKLYYIFDYYISFNKQIIISSLFSFPELHFIQENIHNLLNCAMKINIK